MICMIHLWIYCDFFFSSFQCLYRETTLAVYGMAVVGMVAYTFTFKLELIAVTFVTAGAVGYVLHLIQNTRFCLYYPQF